MAIVLDSCLGSILCALGRPVLAALASAIQVQIAYLEAQLRAVQAQLVVVQLLTAPIAVASGQISDFIESVRSGVNLIPIQIITEGLSGCLPIGNLNLLINETLDNVVAAAQAKLDEWNAVLDKEDELQQLENLIESAIEFFTAVVEEIARCPTGV